MQYFKPDTIFVGYSYCQMSKHLSPVQESGRFVPTDVSYPDDSYAKLRWFVPNAKMIRSQSLDDSYPTAFW